MDVTYLVGLRIGEDMARTHMTSLSSAFFSAFDKVYDQEGKALTSDEEQDALKGSADLNFPTIFDWFCIYNWRIASKNNSVILS